MDNLLEIIIPIIFFIIWIFSSIAESNKKRQRRGAPPTGTPYPQPSDRSPTTSSNPMDELKRTLENIFGEMGQESNEEKEEEPPPPETHKKQEAIPVKPPVEKAIKSYRERVKKEQLEMTKFYENYQPEEGTSIGNVSPQVLRKAIVLMEIMSPPVSLRE